MIVKPKLTLPNASSQSPKMSNQTTSAVEMVDLSDDDDIIFETDPLQPNASNALPTSKPSVITPRGSKVSIDNQPKSSADDDKIIISDDDDDDDVIEVLEPSRTSSLQGKPNPNTNLVAKIAQPLAKQYCSKKNTPSDKIMSTPAVEKSAKPVNPKSQSLLKKNMVEVDDVIEVMESPEKTSVNSKPASLPEKKDHQSKETKEPPQKPKCNKYVVDITDDERKKEKRKIENKCLNPACESGEDLASAAMFVISYYGCKIKKGKYEVCAVCFDAAVRHQEELANRLRLGKPLLSYEHFPINDIQVVDLESDEETSESEDPVPFSLLQDVEKNLELVLSESLAKYDIDYQIQEATGILTERMTSLELDAKKMDDEYDQLQKDIDEMRRNVYKNFDPIRKELPSIDIRAYPPPNFPISHITTLPMPQHQSLRDLQPQLPGQPRGVAMKKVTYSPSRTIAPRRDGSSQEVVALSTQVSAPQIPLPPIGVLLRPKPRANDVVYVMKMSEFGVWLKGRVIEVVNSASAGTPMHQMHQTLYKVKMEIQGNRKHFSVKTVHGRHLAYPNPAQVRLSVGTRVIAVFQDDESHNQNKGGSYYSGLIAEPPKSNNKFRYLVFFDDGYAQYVPHNKILVVCESSRNVWDDINPDSREFIRKYLEQYPERPMVKLAANQVVKTEWNGKWWIARVVEVDGSLVKMSFDADKRTEWIYRGSTRLAPLYTELAQQQARLESGGTGTISRMRGLGMRRMNQPYVEYTQNIGAEDDMNEPAVTAPSTTVRAVAKKSTTKKFEAQVSPIRSTVRPAAFFSPESIGVVKELQLPKDAPMPKRFQAHTCGPHCIEFIKYDPIKMRGYNPLSKPLYCGWQRELPKYRKKSTVVMYTAPCGRRLRNMQDLHRYLCKCNSNMSVDLFDFDQMVNALSEFTLLDTVKKYIHQEDMTHGKENVKIPLINYVDHSLPHSLQYETQRIPYDNVPLNTDPNFLCGCDCTDDCRNKEKCACWQLTIQGSSLYPGGVVDPNVGYDYKRLQERVITGIYECNDRCHCKQTCLNRVVQHPLQLKLQLFKTPSKGWGLRCLNDIPKGTFICIYAGYLYTEQTANTIGGQDGDDYLAELDYIEVVERMKEDYESDVEDELMDEEETQPKSTSNASAKNRSKEDADADFKMGWTKPSLDSSDDTIRSRLRKRTAAELESGDDNRNFDRGAKRRESSEKGDIEGDDDESDYNKLERLPSSFTPKPLRKPEATVEKPVHRFQSVRKFYGPNERVYIMDANKVGNIGRYLNHSCSPNVFVQNVFVDTHDLRFPWVAFFSLTYIKAGTELTWDYNYEVGSVPDKQIICRCGSSECRGRLL